MALCEKGLDGPALAEFFEEKCGAVVKETMTGVVEGALEACALTAAFPSAKEAYNAIAGKVPGLDEIELDLPTYVLDNFVEGCKTLLCEKEYDAKAGAKDSGDDDLMELFGDFLDPDSSDSSDSESDAGDDATADAGGEGGATKVLTDLGASVTTMAEGMFATVGAPTSRSKSSNSISPGPVAGSGLQPVRDVKRVDLRDERVRLVRPRREVRPQLREGRHPEQLEHRRAVRDDLHEHDGQLPEDDVVVGPQMGLVGPRQAPVQLEVRPPI